MGVEICKIRCSLCRTSACRALPFWLDATGRVDISSQKYWHFRDRHRTFRGVY
jgi:hypothetical protein